jgi:hypothetical protein
MARRQRMNRILSSLLLASALSCGSTTVTGKDIATSCAVDVDCVAVFLGDVCGKCTCPTTGISRASKSTYDAEYAAAVKGCSGGPVNTCACVEVSAKCASGTCTIASP